MGSVLVVTSVEKLQNGINSVIKTLSSTDMSTVYISLNKQHQSVIKSLNESKINPKKIFFIDCISSNKNSEDVLYINPRDLDDLNYAINTFIKQIEGKKFVLIDSLATLLLYNKVDRVAKFVKILTEYSSQKDVQVVALSQKTAEELLSKIYNFFDNVENKS